MQGALELSDRFSQPVQGSSGSLPRQKKRLAITAALRDMQRHTIQVDSGSAGHGGMAAWRHGGMAARNISRLARLITC